MKEQFNNRMVLPDEEINLPHAKANTQSFVHENGHLKSLYYGLVVEHQIGSQSYLDLSKKVTTYFPEKNHFLIGIVKAKAADSFVVDINAPTDGTLGALDFDGASKRNRPSLSPGDIVFARVADYSKFIGAKLSCLNAGFSAGKVLGELKGGVVVSGLRGREKLVEQKMEFLKNYCKFEVAFGKNDLLWFSSEVPKTEMLLYNIFCQLLSGCSEQLFQSLLQSLRQ